jgi:hypothetical protein
MAALSEDADLIAFLELTRTARRGRCGDGNDVWRHTSADGLLFVGTETELLAIRLDPGSLSHSAGSRGNLARRLAAK